MKKAITILAFLLVLSFRMFADAILVPMDSTQKNHLKAYGITYRALANGGTASWLLNYNGGSFMLPCTVATESECIASGVSFNHINDMEHNHIMKYIFNQQNMTVVKLEKQPKIAVYTPLKDGKPIDQPWDDAVTLALDYAGIPYDVIYDNEIMQGSLGQYDWLHIHHEDFTGQSGKLWYQYQTYPWYQEIVAMNQAMAAKWGFPKISQLKLAVAKKIKEYVGNGGFMFAMCAATESFDIALSAEGLDICAIPFDGDPQDPGFNDRLDFSKTFAFQNYSVETNPLDYSNSCINVGQIRPYAQEKDSFTLNSFSVNTDPVAAMLTQNHTMGIKGFIGKTTAFNNQYIKPEVTILGGNAFLKESRYIHGNFGRGMWTFYGGHDPEDYAHIIGSKPNDLSKYPNSPGYRLILNNILTGSVITQEMAENTISISPNPCISGKGMQVETDGEAGYTIMKIYAADGKQIIMNGAWNMQSKSNLIQIPNLKPGMYLLELSSPNAVVRKKFVVQ